MNKAMDDQAKRWRGGLLIALVGFTLLIVSKWIFALLCVCFLYLAAEEFIQLSKASGAKPLDWVLRVICPACIVFATISYKAFCTWLAVSSIIIMCSFVLRSFYGLKIEVNLSDVASSFFCVVYVGWLPSHIVLLRFLHSPFHWSVPHLAKDSGLFFALIPLVTTVLNDIASYYFGKIFGRTKLAQSISPNKTIKGSVGGVLCGILVSFLLAFFVAPLFNLQFSWWQVLLLAVLCSLLAQLGDLAESLMKRSVGLKDAGQFIEGHGGLMDRFDSHILPYVVSYYFFSNGLAIFN